MRLTVRQLRDLIAEALDMLPPRNEVESQIQRAKSDKGALSKVLSSLERKLPTGARLLMQNLARVAQAWQAGRVGFDAVTTALGRIYDSQVPRRSSYASMRAA